MANTNLSKLLITLRNTMAAKQQANNNKTEEKKNETLFNIPQEEEKPVDLLNDSMFTGIVDFSSTKNDTPPNENPAPAAQSNNTKATTSNLTKLLKTLRNNMAGANAQKAETTTQAQNSTANTQAQSSQPQPTQAPQSQVRPQTPTQAPQPQPQTPTQNNNSQQRSNNAQTSSSAASNNTAENLSKLLNNLRNRLTNENASTTQGATTGGTTGTTTRNNTGGVTDNTTDPAGSSAELLRQTSLNSLKSLLNNDFIYNANAVSKLSNVTYTADNKVNTFTINGQTFKVEYDVQGNAEKLLSENADGTGIFLTYSKTGNSSFISQKDEITKMQISGKPDLLKKVETKYSSKGIVSSEKTYYLVNGEWTTKYPYSTSGYTGSNKVPTIEFPEIPEEKGSYNEGTLVLYDTDTFDDGSYTKIWDYSYSDRTDTRTVTQLYDALGVLQGTLVEDYKYDNEGNVIYGLLTEFDAESNYVGKDLYTVEITTPEIDFSSYGVDPQSMGVDISMPGIMKITTIHDPVIEGVEPTEEVQEIEMPKNVVSMEMPFDTTARNTLLESLADIVNIDYNVDFSTFSALDKYDFAFDCPYLSPPGLGGESFDKFINDLLHTCLNADFINDTITFEKNEETGLISKLFIDNGFEIYEFKYDENNRISSLIYKTDIYEASYNFERDNKDNINLIKINASYINSDLYSSELKVDENRKIINTKINYNNFENGGSYLIEFDENFNVKSYESIYKTPSGNKEWIDLYNPDTKQLTVTEKENGTDYYIQTATTYNVQGTLFKSTEEDTSISQDSQMQYGSGFSKSVTTTNLYLGGTSTTITDDGVIYKYYDESSLEEYYPDSDSTATALRIYYPDGTIYEYKEAVHNWYRYNDELTTYSSIAEANGNVYDLPYVGRGHKLIISNGSEVSYQVAQEIPPAPEARTQLDEKYYVNVEDLIIDNNNKFEQENFDKKAISEMSDEEIISEIEELHKKLFIDKIDNSIEKEGEIDYGITISKTGNSIVDRGINERTLKNLREMVAILDTSEVNGENVSSSSQLDGQVGTVITPVNNTSNTSNNPVVDEKKQIEELKEKIKEQLRLADNSNLQYGDKSWFKNNYDAIAKVLYNPFATLQELQDVYKKFPQLDGVVDRNFQGMGDCWLLAAINTRLGESISDIVHKNADGSCTVTFKETLIPIKYEEKLQFKTFLTATSVKMTSDPIKVEQFEYKNRYYIGLRGTYQNLQLSTGDPDIKAIEYAYFKYLDEHGVDLSKISTGNPCAISLALLYGQDNVTTINDITSLETANAIKNSRLTTLIMGSFITAKFKNPRTYQSSLEELYLVNDGRKMAAGTEFSNYSDTQYNLSLEKKKQLLINSGYYSEQEILNAINTCRHRFGNSRDGQKVTIPTKSGGRVDIYGSHAYTVVDISNDYVKLINPHNNTETFEISTIYFKILFSDLSYAQVN